MDILDLAKKPINELSGGQRQRVTIARALAAEPKILLLDEPTASVDSRSSSQMYDLLAELNQTISILLISHDLTAISTYVKTIGCINRRLIYHGQKEITSEMLSIAYECPVDLVAHGLPHRVLPHHHEDDNYD
jgi:zinc transport system ATP-binding protein